MPHPHQDNHDDCGVFAVLFASQLAAGADLHFIQPERTVHFRLYLALCLLEQQQPGLVCSHEATQNEAPGVACLACDKTCRDLQALPGRVLLV